MKSLVITILRRNVHVFIHPECAFIHSNPSFVRPSINPSIWRLQSSFQHFHNSSIQLTIPTTLDYCRHPFTDPFTDPFIDPSTDPFTDPSQCLLVQLTCHAVTRHFQAHVVINNVTFFVAIVANFQITKFQLYFFYFFINVPKNQLTFSRQLHEPTSSSSLIVHSKVSS